jgi:hypothetical protein
MLILELMVYRYGLYLSQEKDHWGESIDGNALRRAVNDYSGELRQIKKQLGLDSMSREKSKGADSIPAYLENLRRRALEFGINRNKMMDKGIELSQQVIALVTLWNNCDEQERLEQRCTAEDVCTWLRDTYIPEFQAVDEAFRQGQQRFWIQEL